MSGFIEWLESLSKGDSKVRAVLKRSLAFEPGACIPAFPYVEPFLQGIERPWKRKAHYLTAGLWASHGHTAGGVTPGRAAALYQLRTKSTNIEARFIALLDADEDQVSHRLRQMVTLLKEEPLDFELLLSGLLHWNDDSRRTQNDWARDFYRTLNTGHHPVAENPTSEENPS
jgi:CRISPR system Cascade subunit CasB